MKTLKNYCISHEPPLLPEKFFDYAIGLGSYRPTRGVHISQLDSYWDLNRPIAYGAAGSYVLPLVSALAGNQTDLTGICSRRKIVLRRPIGREAPNYPTMRETTTAELSLLNPDLMHPRDEFDFLVPMPLEIPQGIIWQYAQAHHVVDLLDYLSVAVQLDVISPSDVSDFASGQYLSPGGCEFGIFPTAWLGEAISKLEIVGREFLDRYGDRIRRYDAYQVRAVGFLSERLGSFFLLKELKRRYPQRTPAGIFGHMCCVVVDGKAYERTEVSG